MLLNRSYEVLLVNSVKFFSAFLENCSHVFSQLTRSCLMKYPNATVIGDRVNHENPIINLLLSKRGSVLIRHRAHLLMFLHLRSRRLLLDLVVVLLAFLRLLC